MDEKTSFEGWAIVELMGHQRIAGLCSEQAIAGTNMLRVDVPELGQQTAFTKFYGGNAIYAITPTDEATARMALSHMETRPVDRWLVPDRPAALPAGQSDVHDVDEFYPDDDFPV